MVELSSSISADVPSFASVTAPASGRMRTNSVGSMSMRTVFSPSGIQRQRKWTSSRRLPMPIRRSHLGQYSYAAAERSPYGLSSPTTPLPLRKLVTGAWISSASAATSSEACWAPAPTTISGLRASRISSAISPIRSMSGAGGGGTVRSVSRSTRAALPNTSQGASIAAGLIRPPCICRNASATTRGASVAWSMRSAQPVKLRRVASWSGSSWS